MQKHNGMRCQKHKWLEFEEEKSGVGEMRGLEMREKGSCEDNYVTSSKLRGDCSFLWLYYLYFDVVE